MGERQRNRESISTRRNIAILYGQAEFDFKVLSNETGRRDLDPEQLLQAPNPADSIREAIMDRSYFVEITRGDLDLAAILGMELGIMAAMDFMRGGKNTLVGLVENNTVKTK